MSEHPQAAEIPEKGDRHPQGNKLISGWVNATQQPEKDGMTQGKNLQFGGKASPGSRPSQAKGRQVVKI